MEKLLDRRFTLLPEGVDLYPNQKELIPHMETRDNVLVLWATSAGKSTAIPLLATADLDKGKSVVYVASFKALAEEKGEDWAEPGQPWENIPKAVITGDHQYVEDNIDTIKQARLISITPESLVSVITNKTSGKASFLSNVGILLIDEGHLVAEEGRGSNMEAAIIEFLHDYPDVRLVVLSGTIPNWREYADWMTQLNGRKTVVLQSDFRPVVLKHHFMAYPSGAAKYSEPARIQKIIDLVTRPEKENQQFLVCVFNKKFGQKIKDHLTAIGIHCEFHNADIKELSSRQNLESAFKRGALRVLISTSTLFTGVNLPARNVIITTCVAAGNDIPAFTIQQAAGRAGRPRYDTEGDVFYFIPSDEFDYHAERIRKGEPIKSQMLRTQVVAAHFIRALYLSRMKNLDDFDAWYRRTLAYVQNDWDETQVQELLNNIVEDMKKCGMLKVDDNGNMELRHRGKICAQLQLDPYVFAQLIGNFRIFFSQARPTDMDLAIAMTKTDSFYSTYITQEEKNAIPDEVKRAPIQSNYWKHTAACYLTIQGKTYKDFPYALNNALFQIKQDLDRLELAMVRACKESEKWTEEGYDARGRKIEVPADERIKLMFARVRMACSWEKARGAFQGMRRSEMRAMDRLGISVENVQGNPDLASKAIRPRRMRELGIG